MTSFSFDDVAPAGGSVVPSLRWLNHVLQASEYQLLIRNRSDSRIVERETTLNIR